MKKNFDKTETNGRYTVMINTFEEMFLREYFMVHAVADRLITDDRAFFGELADAFMIDDSERLYALSHGEYVSDIKTFNDYARFCRTRTYYAFSEIDDGLDGDVHEMISIKGSALKKAGELKIACAPNSTAMFTADRLCEFADLGIVPALRIVGFLKAAGIGFAPDMGRALKYIDRAAQWNSIEGILYALRFDKDRRGLAMNRLRTVAEHTVYEGLLRRAESRYKIKANNTLPESILLKEAIVSSVVKADINMPQQARVVFSGIMDIRDKERTLFSPGEQAISDTADLPLKLCSHALKCDPAAIEGLGVNREDERDRILRYAANCDLRARSAYRPLCINTDSEYLSAMHLRALKRAFGDAHTEKIDVGGLTDYDIEPSANNIFVRSCDEDADNVYFLIFRGDIDERFMQAATAFLNSAKRKRFRLARPSVVLDLGTILPVCFCDKANAKRLNDCCDVVSLADITQTEKESLIDVMAESARISYCAGNVVLKDDARAKLAALGADVIARVIDRAVRLNRKPDADVVIDANAVEESVCAEHSNKKRIGFGGALDEI